MIWTAQYGIIAQQVLSSMLRSSTVAGMSPLGDAMPLEGLMLQGTYALVACSMVHRVRIYSVQASHKGSVGSLYRCSMCGRYTLEWSRVRRVGWSGGRV